MRILIADSEDTRAKGIAEACIARGLVVENASHGAAALELALERVPDMVICALELPVIDGLRLAEILRGNPRTRSVSFLFLVKDELDAPMAMGPRDGLVASPWDADAVLAHVDAVLERNTRFGSPRVDSEVSGQLAQISVLDLLQVFQMNRKTGTLRVFRAGGESSGAVVVCGGQVVDASIPLPDGTTITREKALFRLLTWSDGRFEFLPGEPSGPIRIQMPMRSLLLEGMRQKDELARTRADLPADISRLCLAGGTEDLRNAAPRGVREVLNAVAIYQRVGEIVDHCSMPDYQVLRALSDLLGRGVLQVETPSSARSPGSVDADGAIFVPAQIRRLREWGQAVRPRSGSVIKVVVVCEDSGALARFREALAESADFLPDPRMAREPRRSGKLGQFTLGEGLSLRLVALPADAGYAPLWQVAAYGMLGAILLCDQAPQGESASTVEEAFAAFARRGSARLARLVTGSGPAARTALPAGLALPGLAAPTFGLPRTRGVECHEALRALFASLVP